MADDASDRLKSMLDTEAAQLAEAAVQGQAQTELRDSEGQAFDDWLTAAVIPAIDPLIQQLNASTHHNAEWSKVGKPATLKVTIDSQLLLVHTSTFDPRNVDVKVHLSSDSYETKGPLTLDRSDATVERVRGTVMTMAQIAIDEKAGRR